MSQKEMETLSEYYQNELSYLRSVGKDFASRFPKIARRLDLSHNESSDPQIERMIESFAFLTGKLQKQIDDQYPEVANSLLSVLYEPITLPTPSCVIINFNVDIERATKTPGFLIPKNTQLHAFSHTGETCSFSTSHDVSLWPVNLKDVKVVSREEIPTYYANSTYYLKIVLDYPEGIVSPNKLRFYINANALLKGKIFSAIFSSNEKILYKKGDEYSFGDSVIPIGIEDEESMFPYPKTVHNGFRLLHEYFSFADKFYGFDIRLSFAINGECTVYIPLGDNLSMHVSSENFLSSAVPAINLFSKITEPLKLDYKSVEYRLVPDYRRYESTEIYSIQKIVEVEQANNAEKAVPEFFSCTHEYESNSISWVSKRKKTCQSNVSGDDIYISFVDRNFNPQYPADRLFYAYTLCTNRYIANEIPVSGEFQIELSAPVKNIYCIDRPTTQKPSIQTGASLWKLISLLSLNTISFSSDGIKKLREVLNIFANICDSRLQKEVDAILSFDSKLHIKRFGDQTWRGFVRGTEIEINFDDSLENGGLPLSLVVSKFLSSYTTLNTFVDVSVKYENKVLRKWDHQIGIQNYL